MKNEEKMQFSTLDNLVDLIIDIWRNMMHFGPVRLSYNSYFSACFFSWNSVFLSQQTAGFFSEANGATRE